MIENLTKLYNTLLLVETKGESTKVMAGCLRFTEQMIQEAKSKAVKDQVPAKDVSEGSEET